MLYLRRSDGLISLWTGGAAVGRAGEGTWEGSRTWPINNTLMSDHDQ